MKAKTKALLLSLCALVLLVGSVFGTMAYLTDTEEAINTFTVGKVDITLDEADVDVYGEKVSPENRVKENTYKLIPGHTYVKDPTVTVIADSEPSYIRMIVTVNNKAKLDAIGVDITAMFTGYNSEKWVLASQTKNDIADTRTYEFRYNTTVSTVDVENKTLEPLFTKMVIPGNVTNAQLNTLEDLKINIVAHAIQADGFTTADAAWAAFTVPTTTQP